MFISVVMATYNGNKYIKEQLDSIKAQTMKPDEVLIIDDCSKDETKETIRHYLKENRLQNWTFIANKYNKGYSQNFIDAINKSKGDIIFLSDQDDIWEIDKVERMIKAFEKFPEAELIVSDLQPMYMSGNAPRVNYQWIWKSRRITKKSSWIKPLRPGCAMCFKRILIERAEKYWFVGFPHDCLLWGNAVLHGTAYYINDKLLRFRRHENNASNRGNHRIDYRIEGMKTELRMMSKYLEKCKDSEIVALIENQKKLYGRRIKALKEKNILQVISFLGGLHLYPRVRYWLTDVYYCVRK